MLNSLQTRGSGVRLFVASAGIILLSVSLIKLISSFGNGKLLSYVDPITQMRFRHELLAIGTIELLAAAYLLLSHNERAKLWLLLWFAVNILEYRIISDLLQVQACPCLGTVGGLLPFSKPQIDSLLRIVTLYLFGGATFFILSSSSTGTREGNAGLADCTLTQSNNRGI